MRVLSTVGSGLHRVDLKASLSSIVLVVVIVIVRVAVLVLVMIMVNSNGNGYSNGKGKSAQAYKFLLKLRSSELTGEVPGKSDIGAIV